MSHLGSWHLNDSLTFPAITHASTGTLTDADAVPSYRVYEDETGTAILNGNMAKLDDANTTGFYSEQIALTSANGFEHGKCYTIYITATVGGITGGQHHTFQIDDDVNTGTGAVAVDHNTGGTDTLRYTSDGSTGIADATVTAYLKSDYDAGVMNVQAFTTTKSDGRWTSPLYLDDGVAYTIVFQKGTQYGPDVEEVTP